ncbi:MAG: response regulator [Acidobacteria bacterium]|nr:response regulator [Acidobacteriota bacterium]
MTTTTGREMMGGLMVDPLLKEIEDLKRRETELRDRVAQLETERAHLLQELSKSAAVAADHARLYRDANEASRAKDEFLATLSHELRTPLNAVLGWVHMLKSGMLAPEASQKALDSIERNAAIQAQLTADLLDVSRVITGKLALECAPVDLATTIDAALDAVRSAASAKNIEISVVVDREACPVWGDASRLQQIIWNLLSNAVKFTPQSGQIQVRLARVDTFTELRVSDTGAGIPQSFLPFVFDRFRQADGTTTRKHGGLGLGLAIVRHLTELHGGTVSAESVGPDRGSTFIVRLPVPAVLTSSTPSADRRPGSETKLQGVRVLVVDDDEDARHLVDAVLEHRGADVKAAASADEAFDMIAADKPDVLLIDICMPGEDGYSLMRRIRELPAAAGGATPAAALTAYSTADDRRQAIAVGFQMYLAKPIDPEVLVDLVATLGGRSKIETV